MILTSEVQSIIKNYCMNKTTDEIIKYMNLYYPLVKYNFYRKNEFTNSMYYYNTIYFYTDYENKIIYITIMP